MKPRNKHRRILILMIASQLLLTGFVVQWIYSQYRGEKVKLIKELTGFYIESQDEILDTLLYKSFVDPVLSENRIILKGRRSADKDSTIVSTEIVTGPHVKKGILQTNGKNETITMSIRQVPDAKVALNDTLKGSGLPKDMLMRSVRLILDKSTDSVRGQNHMVQSIDFDLDTTMFKNTFHSRLSGTGMKFNIEWKKNNNSPVNEKSRKMIYIKAAGHGTVLPEAGVERYFGYLIGRILPQIIFGVVLVLITALAFLLSFRSIRNHILLNDLRNEFVANITHELKTPVATLKVALESLGKFNMRNEPLVMEEYLRLASVETIRLEDLINRVLDHSLLEEHEHALIREETEINSLISEVADTMRQRIENKGKLEFIQGEELLVVIGDPLYLKGVIANLIDNSIKYCDKEPAILIKSGRKAGFAIIEVTDNGPGIPEEYQRKVFEKFFRLPSDNLHNVKGYGLGLSFASLVMKHHNGSIEVRNLEQGCSFTITIPLA